MEDLRPLEVAQAKDFLTKAYDQVASAWDRYVVPATAAVRERLLELAQLRPDERVLEVGTGTGSTALLAAQRVGRSGYVLGITVLRGCSRKLGKTPPSRGR